MKVTDSISIEASPETVWAVTVDIERWPEWTPTVTSAKREDSGPFGIGSAARLKQPLQSEARWVVTEFDPGKRFAWETRRAGMHLTGTHELSAGGKGTTSLLSVEARGPLALILWPVLSIAIGRALSEENRGLRARCEGLV